MITALMRRRTGKTFLAVATLAIGAGGLAACGDSIVIPEPVCTVKWVGPASGGTWETASNWDTNAVPTSTDAACDDTNASISLSSAAPVTGLKMTGELIVEPGGHLSVTDGPVVSGVPTLILRGKLTLGSGVLFINAAGGSLEGDGLGAKAEIDGFGSMLMANAVVDGDGVALRDNTSLTLASASAWNAGGIDMSDASNLTFQDTVTIYDGAFIAKLSGSPLVVNNGVLTVNAPSNGFTIGTAFDQGTGAVMDIQAGEVFVDGPTVGGDSGTYQIAGSAQILFTTGTRQHTSSASFTGAGTVLVDSGSTMVFNAPVTLNNLYVYFGTLSGTITATGSSTLYDATWQAGGLTVPPGSTSYMYSLGFTEFQSGFLLRNQGTMTIESGLIGFCGDATLRNSGVMSITGQVNFAPTGPNTSCTATSASVINTGSMTVNTSSTGGGTAVFGVPLSTSATLNVNGNTTLQLAGATQSGGTTTVQAGSVISTSGPAYTLSSGTVTGGGVLNLTLNSSGTVAPGGTSNVTMGIGQWAPTASSTYAATISSAGSYDLIQSTSPVTLNGTLAVTLQGGYIPTAGTTFTMVFAGGGLSGSFSTLNLPTLPGGRTWSTSIVSGNQFRLTAN